MIFPAHSPLGLARPSRGLPAHSILVRRKMLSVISVRLYADSSCLFFAPASCQVLDQLCLIAITDLVGVRWRRFGLVYALAS